MNGSGIAGFNELPFDLERGVDFDPFGKIIYFWWD